MRDKSKKILSVLAATAMCGALVLSSCGQVQYLGDDLGTVTFTEASATSNGGFAVEKDGYVYFINGSESYTASNAYGDAVKGALMRISKEDLTSGNYENVKTVVPQLFVAQNFDAGIYIYGEYVYYATPTTDKSTNDNTVMNTWLDFKRAKLDGTEGPMSDYYFRLKSYSSEYRFVEMGEGANKTVYCLYEEDGVLKSFNTKTRKATVLVDGADDYYYDTSDLSNPVVYYTMSVTKDIETTNYTSLDYTQLYCVDAAATVTSINASEASYTTSNGTKYDFDKSAMQAQNDAGNTSYDFNDYTTYPYVNLGSLVLDGVGRNSADSIFNQDDKTDADNSAGYKYTIVTNENGGVYFTRSNVQSSGSPDGAAPLYYLSNATRTATNDWNAVTGNGLVETAAAKSVIVTDTTNYTSWKLEKLSNGHRIYYVNSDGKLYYEDYNKIAGETEATAKKAVEMTDEATSMTLWTIEGDYLYYYGASSEGNGNNVTRIKIADDEKAEDAQVKYSNTVFTQDSEKLEYAPITVALVDWNSGWYAPEFFGNTLLYSNAQSFGSVSYNYIYAIQLGDDRAALQEQLDAVQAVKDEMDNYTDEDLIAAMEYYYRTGSRTAFDAVIAEYTEDQKTEFDKFIEKFNDGTLKLESSLIDRVGKLNEDDKQAIADAWAASLLQPEEDDETAGLEAWAIVLIVAGSVLVVAAAVLIPLFIVRHKKKKAAKAEAEATVNAYKRKNIDITDDKLIDVYADEEKVETSEEAEAPAEEAGEEAEEKTEE